MCGGGEQQSPRALDEVVDLLIRRHLLPRQALIQFSREALNRVALGGKPPAIDEVLRVGDQPGGEFLCTSNVCGKFLRTSDPMRSEGGVGT